MASPKVQCAVDNLGNGGTESVTFYGVQIAGRANVVCIWAPLPTHPSRRWHLITKDEFHV